MAQDTSPVTGIIQEEQVVIDFGEFEGKTVLEIADTVPDFYQFLAEQREMGNFLIRRKHDKTYRLYVHEARVTHLN